MLALCVIAGSVGSLKRCPQCRGAADFLQVLYNIQQFGGCGLCAVVLYLCESGRDVCSREVGRGHQMPGPSQSAGRPFGDLAPSR